MDKFNNKIQGFIPFEDSDGIKHTIAVSVYVDVENLGFGAVVEIDGEVMAPDTPTIASDIYVAWTQAS